jgi:phosphoribosylformimino-5-aminoimidazole carboxamide ribotide isomerase
MDLKGGAVVHAVAGRRDEYRPIRSPLCPDSSPAAVARVFRDTCGCHDVYVADLDAIAGSESAWESYDAIGDAGLRLILDAGVSTADHARRLAVFADHSGSIAAVVVGLEAIADEGNLAAAIELFGPKQAIFSLDLKHGRPMCANPAWRDWSPLRIVEAVARVGYRRLIVLDLAAVGTDGGPATTVLCREIRQLGIVSELISGGGVRDDFDVNILCKAGCDRVLVASALHAGKLTVR